MADTDFGLFAFERFRALPRELRQQAVGILTAAIPAGDLERIKQLHATYDDEWWSVAGYHFYGGMAVRNLLRSGGIRDDQLPEYDGHQNWDDYYIPVLEAAAGVRDLETGEILE